MSACNDTTTHRYGGFRHSTRTIKFADACSYTRGTRMAEGRRITCPHGHGATDNVRCAELCRAGDAICHRSGSACALGMLAMSKVQEVQQ